MANGQSEIVQGRYCILAEESKTKPTSIINKVWSKEWIFNLSYFNQENKISFNLSYLMCWKDHLPSLCFVKSCVIRFLPLFGHFPNAIFPVNVTGLKLITRLNSLLVKFPPTRRFNATQRIKLNVPRAHKTKFQLQLVVQGSEGHLLPRQDPCSFPLPPTPCTLFSSLRWNHKNFSANMANNLANDIL